MAEDKTSGEGSTKSTKTEPEEEKVERERLIAESQQFFGVSPQVVAGTLYGLDRRQHAFAPSAVKAAIDKFLKRPVKEA